MAKCCIFIVGARNSGKTSTIVALTGCRKEGLWNVRSLRGRPLKALVLLSAITERGAANHLPTNFPNSIEADFELTRRKYDVLICPFELKTWKKYDLGGYIQSVQSKGFLVKVAIIKTDWQGNTRDISKMLSICRRSGIKPRKINANNDYNIESSAIRKAFYPT